MTEDMGWELFSPHQENSYVHLWNILIRFMLKIPFI